MRRTLSERLRRLLLSALICVPAAFGLSSCTPPPLRVEMWGDSIASQASPYVNFFLGISGKATSRTHVFPGTALCDWLPDIRRELDPANPAGFHPQAVVLEFIGVPWFQCMRDARGVSLSGQALIDKVASDSAVAIGIASRARVPVYFASAPIFRGDAGRYVGDTPLGVMYSRLPARFPGGLIRFIDAALSVEWRGHYTDTLPCLPFEHCTGHWPDGTPTVVVREADGVHFCPVPEVAGLPPYCPVPSPGAMRYAMAITSRVLHDFHLG